MLEGIDDIRKETNKKSVKEAVILMKDETHNYCELINRVASYLACIRDEKLEFSRRIYEIEKLNKIPQDYSDREQGL